MLKSKQLKPEGKMSKIVEFKVRENHDATYLKSETNEILKQLPADADIDKVIIEMDFRVYADNVFDIRALASYYGITEVGISVVNDNNYRGILENKQKGLYPIKGPKGNSLADIYDGDWAIDQICKALHSTQVKTIEFSNCQFYPGSLESLKQLKNDFIQEIKFTKCMFYNADTKFFADNFPADLCPKIDIDSDTVIYQKGDNLGVAGNTEVVEEHFTEINSNDGTVDLAGDNEDNTGEGSY